MRLTRWKTVQAMFADSRHRLFAVWFLVILGLTQHDLILKPVQPIHFSHGYDWIALFFLGAPVLEEILNAALSIRARGIRAAVLAGFLLLFCSDNLIWFFSFWTPVQRYALELTAEQKGVLDWLRANATAETMVVTDDRLTGYLVATYSPARSWFGHDYNTPHAAERRREIELLFSQARLLDQWRDGRTWIVASALSRPPIQAAELYRNAGYVILAAR